MLLPPSDSSFRALGIRPCECSVDVLGGKKEVGEKKGRGKKSRRSAAVSGRTERPPGAGAEQAGAAARGCVTSQHCVRTSVGTCLHSAYSTQGQHVCCSPLCPSGGGRKPSARRGCPGEAAWPWCEQSWRGQVQGVLVVCVAGK